MDRGVLRMSASTVLREAIAAVIETVPDVGVVHRYERHADLAGELRALYQPDGEDVIRGWHIRRTQRAEHRHSSLLNVVTTTWAITGVASLQDAEQSEVALDELLDAIVEAFRRSRFLGGLADTIIETVAGPQLKESDSVTFADELCNRVVLGLTTVHFETPEEDAIPCDAETMLRVAWDLAGMPTPDNQAVEAEDTINLEDT